MNWFIIKEFFREIDGLDIISILSLLAAFYVTINIFIVTFYYDRRINKIEKEKQKRINEITEGSKGKDITTTFLQRQIDYIDKEYKNELENLNRKRKFILERLPFFKN